MHVCLGPRPPALEVTGDLDKEDRRVGGCGGDLGGAYGMVRRDRRATTRGGFFCLPFPSCLLRDRSHAGARLGWPGVPPERRPAEPRFGGSGPSIVKVEQQFSCAFLDK
jgi:hypothetical protein